MVGSVIEAGRPDIARSLMNALEPPQRMTELEAQGMNREEAAETLALERRVEGLPSAPGASHPLSAAQIEARKTSEPSALTVSLLPRQVNAGQVAVANVGTRRSEQRYWEACSALGTPSIMRRFRSGPSISMWSARRVESTRKKRMFCHINKGVESSLPTIKSWCNRPVVAKRSRIRLQNS